MNATFPLLNPLDHLPQPPCSTSLDPVESESQLAADLPAEGGRTDETLEISFRHSGWRALRRRVLGSFARVCSSRSRVERFTNCGSFAWVLQDRGNPDRYTVSASHCHDRFCVPCALARGRAVAHHLATQAAGRRILFVTLTLRSAPVPLAQQLDRLYAAFARLRRIALWRATIRGGAAVLELTWSAKRGLWHPHLHILAEGSWIPHGDLRSAWHRITGDSHVVDVRLARTADDVAGYAAKYLTKPIAASWARIDDCIDEAVSALAGRKLCLTFGTWRGLRLTDPPDPGDWQAVAPLEDILRDAANGLPYATRILRLLKEPQSCHSPHGPPF